MMLKVALLLLVVGASASHITVKRNRLRLCGRQLNQAISLVCHGRYYDPNDRSRNAVQPRRSLRTDPFASNLFKAWIHASKPLTNSWTSNLEDLEGTWIDIGREVNEGDRPRRGVVDECCRSSCTITQLQAYCMPPETATTLREP